MIALVDYKAGNLTSVKKALATIGAAVIVPGAPDEIADASGVIVPGVGHFGATRALDAPWIEAILGRIGEGRPLLGICLGMQWLFEGSDEAPELPGLGLLSGRCYRLGWSAKPSGERSPTDARLKPSRSPVNQAPTPDRDPIVKVPHVGWNSLDIQRSEASILEGVPQGAQVYFTHSYVAPITGDAAAVTEHGEPFAAVVQRGYIAGVQFHPEKSGDVGLRILRNFVELAG